MADTARGALPSLQDGSSGTKDRSEKRSGSTNRGSEPREATDEIDEVDSDPPLPDQAHAAETDSYDLHPWASEEDTPALVSDPKTPPLDARVIEELDQLAEGGNLVDEIAGLFLADAATDVALIADTIARGDSATLVQVAHRLQGSSANLGATELARLCSILHASIDSSDLLNAETVLVAIRSELERVRSAFNQRVSLQ